MEASLESLKIELIQWLTTVQDESIIKKLLAFQRASESEKKIRLTEEELRSIEAGLEDLKNGRTHSHEEVRKLYEKWL